MKKILIVLLILSTPTLAQAQKKPKQPPEPGTVFQVSDGKPSWATCDVEFRDPSGGRWPNFFFGKPAGNGSFTFDEDRPRVSLALRCDQQAQKNGDQSRRVLAGLLAEGKSSVVVLSLQQMGKLVRDKVTTKNAAGKTVTKVAEYAPTTATLEIDGKKVPVKARTSLRWNYDKNAERPSSVYLDVSFTVSPDQLGVKGLSGPIVCRAGVTAYTTLPEPKKRRK